MIEIITSWYKRNLSDPQIVILLLLLIAGFGLVIWFGDMLAPILWSVVIAYLLNAIIDFLERRKVPHWLALTIVFSGFIGLLAVSFFVLLPIMFQQLIRLMNELPGMIYSSQQQLATLPQKYSDFISADQLNQVLTFMRNMLSQSGQKIISFTLGLLPGLISLLVYLVLVPLLVFYLLKDKDELLEWCGSYMPQNRGMLMRVWQQVDLQMGNYLQGKVLEIIIVIVANYAVFWWFELQYAILFAILVGFSVIVPYIGAVAVTIPIAIVAFFQWGFDSNFIWLMIWYFILQALDGNVLVPILFSEAVSLHPIAIIGSVVVFGGLFGFWGLFFSIPLAILVKAVLDAWPRQKENIK
jgi:putative permease